MSPMGTGEVDSQTLDNHDNDSGMGSVGTESSGLSDNDENLLAEELEVDLLGSKAEELARFVVSSLIGKTDSTADPVEATLLRCIKKMLEKHEILFRGMMRRLDVNRETGYVTFVAIANELFEGERKVDNWGRVIALYAFGGQLALHCQENGMGDFVGNIAEFMGRYANEVVTPFVRSQGGWNQLCTVFPPEDNLDNTIWTVLSWTAIGFGLAAAASFFTSH